MENMNDRTKRATAKTMTIDTRGLRTVYDSLWPQHDVAAHDLATSLDSALKSLRRAEKLMVKARCARLRNAVDSGAGK